MDTPIGFSAAALFIMLLISQLLEILAGPIVLSP